MILPSEHMMDMVEVTRRSHVQRDDTFAISYAPDHIPCFQHDRLPWQGLCSVVANYRSTVCRCYGFTSSVRYTRGASAALCYPRPLRPPALIETSQRLDSAYLVFQQDIKVSPEPHELRPKRRQSSTCTTAAHAAMARTLAAFRHCDVSTPCAMAACSPTLFPRCRQVCQSVCVCAVLHRRGHSPP